MTEQDVTECIKAELVALKSEEVNLNHKYKHTYHFVMGSFNLLPDLAHVRKRRVALKDALRILEEFK